MIWLRYWKPLLIAAVLLLLAVGWRADSAAQYRAGKTDATAAISAELAKSAVKRAEQAREAAADYQAEKGEREQKERVRYVEIPKIVERVEYRNACLDSDGLHIINSAVADGQ